MALPPNIPGTGSGLQQDPWLVTGIVMRTTNNILDLLNAFLENPLRSADPLYFEFTPPATGWWAVRFYWPEAQTDFQVRLGNRSSPLFRAPASPPPLSHIANLRSNTRYLIQVVPVSPGSTIRARWSEVRRNFQRPTTFFDMEVVRVPAPTLPGRPIEGEQVLEQPRTIAVRAQPMPGEREDLELDWVWELWTADNTAEVVDRNGTHRVRMTPLREPVGRFTGLERETDYTVRAFLMSQAGRSPALAIPASTRMDMTGIRMAPESGDESPFTRIAASGWWPILNIGGERIRVDGVPMIGAVGGIGPASFETLESGLRQVAREGWQVVVRYYWPDGSLALKRRPVTRDQQTEQNPATLVSIRGALYVVHQTVWDGETGLTLVVLPATQAEYGGLPPAEGFPLE